MTFFGIESGFTGPEEEGGFNEDPPEPNGTIVKDHSVVILKSEFVETSAGYRLDLNFFDNYYRQTQNAVYSRYTINVGAGKLQTPSQLPTYTIRLFKKSLPAGAVNPYDNISSLWQPYGTFNSQTFINADDHGTDFTATDYGVGITPYAYWYPTVPQIYSYIREADASNGSGEFAISLDARGGVKYTNSPDFSASNFPSGFTLGSSQGVPDTTTPLQQFIAGKTETLGSYVPQRQHILPRWKYCRSYSTENLFSEPGAYLIAITRNAVDNEFVGTQNGNPNQWNINLLNSQPNVSLAYMIIEPPPLSPITIANDVLSFEVTGYGSVSPVYPDNGGQYKYALRNQYEGTPNFTFPGYSYNIGPNQNKYGSYDHNQLTYFPTDPNDASVSIVVKTAKEDIIRDYTGNDAFNVRGAFQYDFRLADTTQEGFMPYANTAPVDNYVNYHASSLDANLVPNFSEIWIPRIRSQVPRLTFSSAQSFGASETVNKYTEEFEVNPFEPPAGPIIGYSPVIINEAKFVQQQHDLNSYLLELTFTDPHYKNTQRGSYAMSIDAEGIGKLQAPNQLPPYIIRVFKKMAPSGGTSTSNKIQSLWQPYGSFNNKTFITGDSGTFGNNNIGAGITPYYYYFTKQTVSYEDISEIDATGGTGTVSIRMDKNGGMQYSNPVSNIGYDSYYAGTHNNNNVSNTLPLQQVVASPADTMGLQNTQRIYGPSYRYCASLDTGEGFSEPGAYLVVVMRNAIENSFSSSGGDFRGVPFFWSVDDNASLTRPSLSSAFLTIDPPGPALYQTDDPNDSDYEYDTLRFTVEGYGSVNEVGEISGSNPLQYRWAITNKFAGTPGFNTPKLPYDTNSLSLSTPQGAYNNFVFEPSDRLQAYERLEVKTNIDILRTAEQSVTSFDVRGAFLYDFRVTESYNPYFNPYADQAAVEGYINYTLSTDTDSKLQPNFAGWISKLRGPNNNLSISDSATFVTPSSAGQQRTLSEVENYYVTTVNFRTLQASIYIPVQLNAFISEHWDTAGRGGVFTLSWEETQSSIITDNIVGSGHVIRIYRRSKIDLPQEGSEFTSNPVTHYKYNSLTDTGASVPSSAVTTTDGNKKNYVVRAGKTSLYTGQTSGTQTYSEQELFGSWMIVLQRNFTPAGATTPILETSCAVVTLPNPPAPVISVETDTYGWPTSLTTSILEIPLQNITSSFVNIDWKKQNSDGSYQDLYTNSGEYELSAEVLGSLSSTVVAKCEARMTFKLNSNIVSETLGSELRLTIYDPNFSKTGYMGPRAINQYSAFNYDETSDPTDVNHPDFPKTLFTPFRKEITPSSTPKKYVFGIYWGEENQGALTYNFVGAKNVLRIFKYEKTNGGYTFLPVSYAKDNGNYDTGLNLSRAYTNYGVPEPTSNGNRMIYLGKNGMVSTDYNNLTNYEFSENDMEGNWLFILQRNFSTTNTQLLVTQGSYYIQLPPPSLELVVDTSLNDEVLITSPVDMFTSNVTNEWFAITVDDEENGVAPTALGDALESYSVLPLLGELKDVWSLDKGPSYIYNKVTADLRYVNPSSYSESLGTYGNIETTGIGYSVPGGSATYTGTTAAVRIYEPTQTPEEQIYLKEVSYSYKTVSGKTYMQVSFTDPDVDELDNDAYIVNIFKKGSGSDDTTQWSGHPVEGFKYMGADNKGPAITKDQVSSAGGSNASEADRELAILISAQGTLSIIKQIDLETVGTSAVSFVPTETFEPGAYLVVIRRTISPIGNSQLAYYTISSGFVFIAPTTTDLTLDNNSLEFTTPIYGSYDSTNNLNISVTPFVTLEGVEEPEPFAISSSIARPPTENGNNVEIDIDEVALKIAYPDSGPISTAVRVTYDWSAPSSFDLDIGKIGGEFQGATPYPTTATTTATGITVAANQAVSNNVRMLMPSNNYWNYEQGNIVRDARASFTGDAKNRLLAIRWEDVKPSDLQSEYTGSPYALRLYKKRREGATASKQWYDPSNGYYGGMSPYYEGAITDPSYANAGVPVEATYLSESDLPSNALDKSIMYIYADASGHIWYNAPPPKVDTEDASKYRPFTDADDSGGYVLVIQRNFGSDPSVPFISTVGTYLHLMPVVSWALTEQGNELVSAPNAEYATYEPGYTTGSGGNKDIVYSWNLALPNIGYSNLIPGETSDTFDIGTFKAEFRNRDKSAVITSNVTYNFSVTELPFMEAYPLQYISGNGFFTATSQDFIVDLCVKPTEFPPPPWPRFSLPCPDVTPEERAALQMRRKAETLMHVSNKHERRMTKAQQYSFIARGFNQKRQTYATQTDNYTNPNTKGYPVLGGNGLALPSECAQRVLTFPSSASDVPGPVVPLTYDPNVPLINYKVVRTYNNSQTEYYDEKGL